MGAMVVPQPGDRCLVAVAAGGAPQEYWVAKTWVDRSGMTRVELRERVLRYEIRAFWRRWHNHRAVRVAFGSAVLVAAVGYVWWVVRGW